MICLKIRTKVKREYAYTQYYSVHRVGSGTLVHGVCRIFDLGETVHLASDSGASGCPSEKGKGTPEREREGGKEGVQG